LEVQARNPYSRLARDGLARVEAYIDQCSVFAAWPIGRYDIALLTSQHLILGLASKTNFLPHLRSFLVRSDQQDPQHAVFKQDSLVVRYREYITCEIEIDSHLGVENCLSPVSPLALKHQKSLQNRDMIRTLP